jgi:hypothetical protein
MHKLRDFYDTTFSSYFTKYNIMLPIRTPLGSIFKNVLRGRELTLYKRKVIIKSSISSKMLREIELATSHS